MCFIMDKTAKKYFIVKDEECYRAGNAHSEFDTWRSSKLVFSTGNGDKAVQSLVFNLDLGWRFCKGCSLSLDWVGIAPALLLSRCDNQRDSTGFPGRKSPAQRVESQHGCEMCRLRCPEHPTPWSKRQEIRPQGGEPRTSPSICCAHLHPILGWLGRGHDFPRSSWDSFKWCFITKALHHRELWTQKKKKSEFVIFLCTILKKIFELGLCTWNVILL